MSKNTHDKSDSKNKNENTQNETSEAISNQQLSPEEESFKDKFLRLNADFQNHKRRIDKERFEWMTEAQIMLLDRFLPIFDELDRAIELCNSSASKEQREWLNGIELIQKNWQKIFKELSITEIIGNESFDPELHDALMQVDAEDKKSGDIVQLLSKGYKYKDKVVRHAKVSVAK